MRSSQWICEVLVLASITSALPEIGISKKERRTAKPIMRKRQDAVGTTVYDILTYSIGGAYYANITVGSPPQAQVVILDTGSADLYFDASSAAACKTSGAYSCRGGTFNPDDSSTYNVVEPSPAFDTRFGDGSTASGPFGEDVICISDVCVSGVQFGVATEVKSTTGFAIGLMGLGYSAIEATHHLYPNIPEVLADANVIDSRLYSVFLNDEGAFSGSILFGGIDTSKYHGTLQTVDILPDKQTGNIDQFITTVTGLKTNVGGSESTIFSGGQNSVEVYRNNDPNTLAVLLDTGSAAWSVPTNVYASIIEQFPYVDKYGTCDCKYADSSDTITVEFAAAISIDIPVREFIIPAYNRTTNTGYTYPSGARQCVFMITPSRGTGQGFDTLGDAVLRSMYVVFDLDQGQLSLAQANVNTTAKPDIRIVSAGPNGVKNAATNVESAPSQSSYPVAHGLNGTATFSISTAKTTIGTATGTKAVPADGQVSATAGAVRGVVVPGGVWTGLIGAGWVLGMLGLGMGLVM